MILTFISILTVAATVAVCALAAVCVGGLLAKWSLFVPLADPVKKCAKVLFTLVPIALFSYLLLRLFVSEEAPEVVLGDKLCVLWLALVCVVVVVLVFDKAVVSLSYSASRFAKKTRCPQRTAFLDKGMYGKYLTSLMFEQVYRDRACYLYNVMIPRPDNSYTKADMIVLSRDGIFVVESKSRGGYLSGDTLGEGWLLEKDDMTHRVPNPVRRNEENVEAVCYYLTPRIARENPLNVANGLAKTIWNVVITPEDTTFNVSGELPSRTFLARRAGFERILRAVARRGAKPLAREEVEEYYELLSELAGRSADFKYRAQQEKRRKPAVDAREKQYCLLKANGIALLARNDGCYWEKFLAEGGPGYWSIAPELEQALPAAQTKALSYGEADRLVGLLKRDSGALLDRWEDGDEKQDSAGMGEMPSLAAPAGGSFLRDLLLAEEGVLRTQTRLGLMYLNGWGIAADEKRATECFITAARQGEPDAMYYVGVMCEHGAGGVKADKDAAAAWYRKAADSGHIGAKNKVASGENGQARAAQKKPAAKKRGPENEG